MDCGVDSSDGGGDPLPSSNVESIVSTNNNDSSSKSSLVVEDVHMSDAAADGGGDELVEKASVSDIDNGNVDGNDRCVFSGVKRARVSNDDENVGDGDNKEGEEKVEGDEMVSRKKRRMRRESGGGGREKGMVMKRVAEIVLVLAAMARMRGGREPTEAEREMMNEARERMVELCQELAPKDIMSRDAFAAIVEDLGLNKLREQRLGFRPPKLSIVERMALSKRKMEESKAFASQPTSLPSQRFQTTAAPGDNRETTPNVGVFSSDKDGNLPASAGSCQPPIPIAPVTSSAVPTPLPYQTPSTTVPVASSTVPHNPLKDSTTVLSLSADRAHVRPDARPNGPAVSPHVPASTATDQRAMRTTPVQLQSQPAPVQLRPPSVSAHIQPRPAFGHLQPHSGNQQPQPASAHLQPQSASVHLQPQAAPYVNVATKNKSSEHLPVRSDSKANIGATPINLSATGVQTPKPVVSQAAPAAVPAMHRPVQVMNSGNASPALNQHVDISKMVQKVLNPKLPVYPSWTPQSREYMNRAVPCQFCKVVINDVENVLVCDACEKGVHLGCLQSYNAKGVPRAEWHCPRCLSMNRGKPFPPKYGRVTRNMNAGKVPSNAPSVPLPSDKKVDSIGQKVNQTVPHTNGNPDIKPQPQAVKVTDSSCQSDHGNAVHENHTHKEVKNMDVSKSEGHSNEALGTVLTSTVSSVHKPPQPEIKPEPSPSEDKLIPETRLRNNVLHASSTSDELLTSSTQTDVGQEKLSNGVTPPQQHGDSNGVIASNKLDDNEKHSKDSRQDHLEDRERVRNQVGELAEPSKNSLHNVDWIGEADNGVDDKKFYQSCRVNGVVYKVHDYALFRSGNGKLIPLKLKAMWEDNRTSSKWLIVHKCYFPHDLPEEVGRPGAPQSNEVYESTHDSSMMAGFIEGPCEVLPFRKFGEDTKQCNQDLQTKDTTGPVYIRNWFYDDERTSFRPSAS